MLDIPSRALIETFELELREISSQYQLYSRSDSAANIIDESSQFRARDQYQTPATTQILSRLTPHSTTDQHSI